MGGDEKEAIEELGREKLKGGIKKRTRDRETKRHREEKGTGEEKSGGRRVKSGESEREKVELWMN